MTIVSLSVLGRLSLFKKSIELLMYWLKKFTFIQVFTLFMLFQAMIKCSEIFKAQLLSKIAQ